MTDQREASAGWAVIVTKPMAEYVAERSIRSGGYRVYAPSYKKMLTGNPTRAGAKRNEIVTRPLFQGYIFVELWPGQEFGEQLFTGVSRLMRHQPVDGKTGRPMLVRDAVIEAIRAAVDGGDFDKLPASRKINASPGDTVRVTDGPLAGAIGELISIDDDKSRAVVAMRLFGRESMTTVENPAGVLEKVERAA